jgi:uncharacterized membrane protein YozB (DUF420 family)
MMKQKHTLEFVFLLMVIGFSVVGFSSLWLGENSHRTPYHYLHIITSLAWLLLLLSQLVLVRQNGFRRHRAIGLSIFIAGPLLVASLMLLSVHSAAKEAATGQADDLLVQNVGTTLEIALLVLLAFVLRRNRDVHASFIMATALVFLGIALFFTFISYVPRFRIEGPETFSRFADASQTISLIIFVIGLLFFLRKWRTGWPWIIAAAFFTLNGLLQLYLDRTDRTRPLTHLVASIGRAPAFGASFLIFAALLWLAWRIDPAKRAITSWSSRQPAPDAAGRDAI